MKILPFTHPQEVPNLYEFLCSAEHKGRYFEESLQPGCFGAPLTFHRKKKYYGSQWCPRTALFPTFFRIYLFLFSRTKKFIQVWNCWGWVNDDRIFIFGWKWKSGTHRHYITFTFSRRFYPKRLTIAFRLYIFISTCVPWESNPQPLALLTQCSTTEPQRNRHHQIMGFLLCDA